MITLTENKRAQLKELSKDYQKNKAEIFDIVWEYYEENAEEIWINYWKEKLKYMPNVKEINYE